MTEKSVLCGELRVPRCPGIYRLVLRALPHLRLLHHYRMSEQAKETCHKPCPSTERPVTA